MSDAQVVYEFEIGRNTVRASVSDFRGQKRLDLRVWFEPQPGAELRPTRQGVSVPIEYLEELEAAVDALKAAAVPPSARSRKSAGRAA